MTLQLTCLKVWHLTCLEPYLPATEIIEIKLRGWNFKIRVLLKQYQHTCKSTGLMLWESARLMASVLAEKP
ncbi:hypothetical protein S83_069742 [Arachis hypogaea]